MFNKPISFPSFPSLQPATSEPSPQQSCPRVPSLPLPTSPIPEAIPEIQLEGDKKDQDLEGSTMGREIPTDSRITINTLPNGLTTYIAQQTGPTPGEGSFRLIIKVGAIHQPLGIAHFVEHCTFKDTPKFPNGILKNAFEEIGCPLGADTNAFTSSDQTEYLLNIPIKNPEDIEKALQALSEIAFHATLKDEDIESERAIILDELRMRRGGSAAEFGHKYRKTVLKNTPYGKMDDEAEKENVKHLSAEQIRAYYHKWYTPDCMAIIAVGDFDTEKISALINKYFASAPKNPNPIQDPPITLSLPEKTQFLPHANPVSTPTLGIEYLDEVDQSEAIEGATVGHLAVCLIKQATLRILKLRLAELAYGAENTPYKDIGLRKKLRFNIMSVFSALSLPWEGKSPEALASLVRELRRAAEFGFSKQEIEDTKEELRKLLESTRKELLNEKPKELADDCSDHFVDNAPLLCPKTLLDLEKVLIEEIDSDLCTTWLKKVLETKHRLILQITRDEKEIDEQALRDALDAVSAEKLSPPKHLTEKKKALIPVPPTPGKIVNRTTHKDTQSITYTLSNGMQVTLRPIEEKKNSVTVCCSTPYGVIHTTQKERPNAEFANTFVSRSGIGSLSNMETDRIPMNGDWERSINSSTSGFEGNVAVSDLEKLFQLQYLTFTDPGFDPAFESDSKQRLLLALKNEENNPDKKFKRTVAELTSDNHPIYRCLREEDIANINYKSTVEIYKKIFADPAQFHTVITGAITEEMVRPLIETYLASIPKTGEGLVDRKAAQPNFPQGITRASVYGGQKSKTALILPSEQDYNALETSRHRRWAVYILANRIDNTARDILGMTYGADTTYGPPSAKGLTNAHTIITFTSEPDHADTLEAEIRKVIENFKQEGPTDKEVENMREYYFRTMKKVEATSVGWNAILTSLYDTPNGFDTFTDYNNDLSQIDAKQLKEAAQFLSSDAFCRVTLLPKSYEKQKEEQVKNSVNLWQRFCNRVKQLSERRAA